MLTITVQAATEAMFSLIKPVSLRSVLIFNAVHLIRMEFVLYATLDITSTQTTFVFLLILFAKHTTIQVTV